MRADSKPEEISHNEKILVYIGKLIHESRYLRVILPEQVENLKATKVSEAMCSSQNNYYNYDTCYHG